MTDHSLVPMAARARGIVVRRAVRADPGVRPCGIEPGDLLNRARERALRALRRRSRSMARRLVARPPAGFSRCDRGARRASAPAHVTRDAGGSDREARAARQLLHARSRRGARAPSRSCRGCGASQVRRHWPDRLEVALEEHVPLARWGDARAREHARRGLRRPPTTASCRCSVGPRGHRQGDRDPVPVLPRAAWPRSARRPVQVQVSPRRAWQVRLDKRAHAGARARARSKRASRASSAPTSARVGAARAPHRLRGSALRERLRGAHTGAEAARRRRSAARRRQKRKAKRHEQGAGQQEAARGARHRHLEDRGDRRRDRSPKAASR